MDNKAEKDDWKPYSLAEYREVAASLVHFSVKGVNSNAEAGGVRLGPEAGLNLPYVSVRCLIGRGIRLAVDYTKNTGNIATVVKQVRKLEGAEHGETGEQAERINAAVANALIGGFETGTAQVSPRLRQVLLPKGEGHYLAATPLPAGGLSKVINERVEAHNTSIAEAYKQAKDTGAATAGIPRRLNLSTLGVGGANPQNVGALVREMQSLLVFEAPTENRSLREAYRIHYQGIPLRPPARAMRAWREWQDRIKDVHGGVLPTDMETREAEREWVVAIALGVLRAGEQAYRLLERHRDELPGGELLAKDLEDAVIRGLINPDERERDWPRSFGQRLAEEVGRYRGWDGESYLVLLNSEALAAIAGWFEEEAR
jgi:hypothetical protein